MSVNGINSEKYLFKKHPKATDQFVSDCRQIEYGDMGVLSAIAVVHEAAHFEDLGFNDKDRKQDLNLYLVTNKHIGGFSNIGSLPGIAKIVNPILKSKYPDLIKSDDSPFMDIHSGYLNDPQSMAAGNLKGMATELNGYTHGLRFEARIKKDIPQKVKLQTSAGAVIEMENSLKPLKQTDGVYYFLFNFNLYLTELKNKYPEHWKNFNNSTNKELLKTLFKSSISTLKEINHCELAKVEDNPRYWLKQIKEIKSSSVLAEFLDGEDLASLNCTSATEKLKEIKDSLTPEKKCD